MKKELALIIAWEITVVFELIIVIMVDGILWKTSFTMLLTLSIMIIYDLWEDYKSDN